MQKTKQICEVLQLVNCTCHAPLKIKLYELERLYGKYSTRVPCEALDVARGTFYNHMLRGIRMTDSYFILTGDVSIHHTRFAHY